MPCFFFFFLKKKPLQIKETNENATAIEQIAEGAYETAMRQLIPQHVAPVMENIETIETDELAIQEAKMIEAIVSEYSSEKVSYKILYANFLFISFF